MQTKFTFKHMEPSDSIIEHAQERIMRLDKYALRKEEKVHFIFSIQKHVQVAEIIIDAGSVHFTAVAKDEKLLAAIDYAIDKLERQFIKHKEKVQNHKDFDQSNEGILTQQIADINKRNAG